MKRLFALALLMLTAGCATIGLGANRPSIYVMRHLHTLEGVKDAQLTDQGLMAALRLPALVRRDRPAVIYVSSTVRAEQTAAPLARQLKIIPRIYDPRDTPALVAAVRQERGTVLIVGHSNTVPDIISQLGGVRPADLTHHDFGDVWHLTGPQPVTTRLRL